MGVITEEIELPDRRALGMPAGLPRPSRRELSEITAFDRHEGDRTRHVIVLAVAGLAATGLYAGFRGDGSTPPTRPPPAPRAAPAIMPPTAEEVTVRPEPVTEPAAPARKLVVVKKSEPMPARGRLAIRSEPRVIVYAGDERLGRTPLDVPIDAGLHELRFVNRRLFLDERRKLRVRAKKKRELDLLFGVSTLKIQAAKGTKVYVDKRYVGTTPTKPIRLVEGHHHLRLVKGGEKMAERLYVPPSRTIDYNARL